MTKQFLMGMYDRHKSVKKISVELNIPYSTLTHIFRGYSINIDCNKNVLCNKEWLIEQYITLDKSCSVIAKEINSTPSTVKKYLLKHDIKFKETNERFVGSKEVYDLLNNKEWMITQYEEHHNCSTIAQIIGSSHNTVAKYLKSYGVKIRKENIFAKDEYVIISENELKDLYINQNLSQTQISIIKNCSRKNVIYYLKKYKIKISPPSQTKKMVELMVYLNDKNWMFEQYKTLGKSCVQIGKEMGLNDETISKYLKSHGIAVDNTYQRSHFEDKLIEFCESIYQGEIIANHKIDLRKEIDIFFPSLNKGIDFYGDLFHANPRLYEPDDYIKKLDMTAQEKWERDSKKEILCKKLKIRRLIIWEYDFQLRLSETKEAIKSFLEIF